MVVAAESGKNYLGQWIGEERALSGDYHEAFGKPMPKIIGIAILADSDDTLSTTTAAIDDISIGWKEGK
jgi:hypothetical protein